MTPAETLSPEETEHLSETFRLLGDPSRLRIVLTCAGGPRAVTRIANDLGLSQSLVSHHLRLLRAARLVRGIRRSKQVLYELSDPHVMSLVLDMVSHVREEQCQPQRYDIADAL